MVRSWVDQLRPLMIVWLLLTLPVVCHHETAVVLLTAAAAGHEHQHMLAEAVGERRPPHATHQHGASHLHGPATPGMAARPSAAPSLAGAPRWDANHGTPAAQGLPTAVDGIAFTTAPDIALPARRDVPPRPADVAAPDSPRRAPPAPPPRALLG
ncbi:MAG TPA: hypothetical protein VFE37_09080 [Chloroflexota bacterium]|nr:hypothetical protein [Chloroflexota bacterium]